MKSNVYIEQQDLMLPKLLSEKNYITVAKQTLMAQSYALDQLAQRIDQSFSKTVNLVLQCAGRLVVCGMGKSGLVGRKIVATLASTGTPSFFLHPAEAFHGDLGMLQPQDLLILISYSGETEEITKIIPSIKSFGNKIVAITGSATSTLAKSADVWLDISVDREACPNNLAPTTSTTVTMALGDALAVALIEARKFQPMDFAKFHPGGSLGKRLLTSVRDRMHKSVPIVTPETTIHECLFTMTRFRLGLVLVVENTNLKGILTDGDLRRALLKDQNILSKSVSDYAIKNPVTIDADSRLIDAENLMQERRIRILIVTEGQDHRLCGILEIFDKAAQK